MAIIEVISFEGGDTGEFLASSGTVSVQSTTKNSGAYAGRVNPTTTGTGNFTHGKQLAGGGTTPINLATTYQDIIVRVDTLPAANDEPILSWYTGGAAYICELRIDSSGNFKFYDNSVSLAGTGTFTVSTGTWYHLQCKVFVNATTGTFDLNVAAHGSTPSSDLALTGLNTGSTNVGRAGIGKQVDRNSQSVDFFYDLIVLDDSSFQSSGLKKASLKPDGAGTYTAWAGTYTDVDDIPHDSDTSYISSTTATDKESVTLTSTTTEGISGTIHCSMSYAVVRDTGTASDCQVFTRSSTSESATSSRNVNASYSTQRKIDVVDPATSVAWTTGGLDAAEVGVTQGSANELRVTALMLAVVYTPAAGGGLGIPIAAYHYNNNAGSRL